MAAALRRKRDPWRTALAIDRGDPPQPLFLRIVRVVVDDISRGRLKPGDRLPGTRTLARSLGVNRVTVLTAYDELVAEGWIVVKPASGARVAEKPPEDRPRRPRAVGLRTTPPTLVPYDLPTAPVVEYAPETINRTLLAFGGNAPDPRLLPVEPLARAYGRVLRRAGGRALAYGATAGHPALRAALASMLSATRGLAATADQLFVTRGSQMALSLVSRALIRPGDVVAVEAIGYRHAWECFRLAGASVIPVPVDDHGLDVTAFAALAESQRIRAVYVTPHHQFPTTVTLPAARRLRLLEVARQHRIAIIEDDYDHEFHYDGRPVLPIASLERSENVIYIGTLSKVLAPGIRIGYIAGPAALVAVIEAHRKFLDVQGDHVVEAAVADLLADGEVARHIRRVRRQYQRRRDALVALLQAAPDGVLSFAVPAGGVAIWARVDTSVDVEVWCARALKRGVVFQTARSFTFDRHPRPFARIGFAALNEAELRTAVGRLLAAIPAGPRASG